MRPRRRIAWSTVAMALAVSAGVALLCALGAWQWQRGTTKRDAARLIAARLALPPATLSHGDLAPEKMAAWQHRRVRIAGRYDAERQILHDNRTWRGHAGYHILTPLQLPGGALLLVNRGWIPLGAGGRDALPALPVSTATRSVAGQLYRPPRGVFRFGEQEESVGWPRRMQTLEAKRLTALLPGALPLILLLDDGDPDGYLRDWQALLPSVGPSADRHFAYAWQWFGLALALLTVALVAAGRRRRSAR